MKRLAPALVVLLVGSLSAPSLASGAFETFGTDPRAKAMAGAQTAVVSSPAAAHYNPAGLAHLPGPSLIGAFSLSLPDVRFDLERDDVVASPVPSYAGTAILAGTGLGRALFDRVFVGVAIYTPAFVYTHASAPDPRVPFAYLYETYTDHWELTPALAVRWFDWLSMGLGLRIGAAQTGSIQLGLDPLRNRITRQSMDAAQIPIYAPTAGVTLGPLGLAGLVTGSLAFSYREHLSLPLAILSSLEVEGLDTEILLPVSLVANYSPRTFNAGLGLTVLGRLEVALDVQYAVWSLAPTPYLNVSSATVGEGIEELGLEGALDAPGPGQSRIAPAGFVDTVNVRAGAEYRLFGDLLSLRAGYGYRPTPVPDQTSGTNVGDANAHVMAAGAGVAVPLPLLLDRPLRVDASWQTQLLVPRRAEKDDAGDSTGSWTMRGQVSELSVAVSYVW